LQKKYEVRKEERLFSKKRKLFDAPKDQQDPQILPPAVFAWLKKINEQLDSNERGRFCRLLQGQNISQKEAEITSRLESELKAKICEFLEKDSSSTKPLHNRGSCQTPAKKRKVTHSSESQVPEKRRKLVGEPPKEPASTSKTQSRRDVSPRENRKGEPRAQDRTTLTKYKLGNVIGQGSFGKVFKPEAVNPERSSRSRR
jgi:hypothetical protein